MRKIIRRVCRINAYTACAIRDIKSRSAQAKKRCQVFQPDVRAEIPRVSVLLNARTSFGKAAHGFLRSKGNDRQIRQIELLGQVRQAIEHLDNAEAVMLLLTDDGQHELHEEIWRQANRIGVKFSSPELVRIAGGCEVSPIVQSQALLKLTERGSKARLSDLMRLMVLAYDSSVSRAARNGLSRRLGEGQLRALDQVQAVIDNHWFTNTPGPLTVNDLLAFPTFRRSRRATDVDGLSDLGLFALVLLGTDSTEVTSAAKKVLVDVADFDETLRDLVRILCPVKHSRRSKE